MMLVIWANGMGRALVEVQKNDVKMQKWIERRTKYRQQKSKMKGTRANGKEERRGRYKYIQTILFLSFVAKKHGRKLRNT